MDQFTKCAALDLASKGIRVNGINPALVKTPLLDKLGLPVEALKNILEKSKFKYPVGRIGEVADTSVAIAYLADNKSASFITGTLLSIDGGALVAGLTEL